MKNLLLLHGALGTKDQFSPLAKALEGKYIIHAFNFSGHGGAPMPDGPFSIESFADEILDYLDKKELSSVCIFGYSLGAYIGMYLAKHFPERIEALITLATKFHWDEHIVRVEIKMLDATVIWQKLPEFARQLQLRHAPQDWTLVLEKTKQLLMGLGKINRLNPLDYKNIHTPCLLLLGDRDKMVTWEETFSVYNKLPNGQMAVLPGTPHPIEKVDVHMISFFLNRFFSPLGNS